MDFQSTIRLLNQNPVVWCYLVLAIVSFMAFMERFFTLFLMKKGIGHAKNLKKIKMFVKLGVAGLVLYLFQLAINYDFIGSDVAGGLVKKVSQEDMVIVNSFAMGIILFSFGSYVVFRSKTEGNQS